MADISRPSSTAAKNKKLTKKLDTISDKLDDTSTTIERRVVDESGKSGYIADFPAYYLPTDRRADREWELKRSLIGGDGGAVPQIQIGDKEMRYLESKRSAEERLKFDQWFASIFNTSDITQQRVAKELHPDYFTAREDYIKRQGELQYRLAMMKLHGPRDKRDLELLYMLQTGNINLRVAPLYLLDGADDKPEERYKRGLFSPARFAKGADYYPHSGRQILETTGRPFKAGKATKQSAEAPTFSGWNGMIDNLVSRASPQRRTGMQITTPELQTS